MRRVVIPPAPGLFSAFGLLCAETERHEVQTFKRPLGLLDAGELEERLRSMEQAILAAFREEGYDEASIRSARTADLRYVGQSFELGIPLETPLPSAAVLRERLGAAFAAEHERRYGHRAPDDPIEVVNLRIVGTVPPASDGGSAGVTSRAAALASAPRPSASPVPPSSPGAERECYFGPRIGLISAALHTRASLGTPEPGPLIIDEYDATILVPPGATACLDAWGNVVIDAGSTE
jgi:N-methylhydantoinase A